MNEQLLDNPKVGEILKEEFLEEIGMSQNALAKAIAVPSNRIHAIVNRTLAKIFCGMIRGFTFH